MNASASRLFRAVLLAAPFLLPHAARADPALPCSTDIQPLDWQTRSDAARPQAELDVVALRGRRIWVVALVNNEGAQNVRTALELAFDLKPGGPPRVNQVHELFAAPGTVSRVLLSAWIDADVERIMVRPLSGPVSGIGLAWRCSKEVEVPAAPSKQQGLLDEAIALYFDNTAQAVADPASMRALAQRFATGAEFPDDAFAAVRSMLWYAGDHHSYIVPPASRGAFYASMAPTPPGVSLRGDGVAVVALSQAGFDNDEDRRVYARSLHAAVSRVAAQHPRGWIVDLRGFGGGDMWPVLAGLSALVDGPLVGEFVGRHDRDPWLVAAGRAGTARAPESTSIGARDAASIAAPIAVLIGPGTASSGEATAIAFERRPRTRFFGQPTLGFYDSGIQQHYLSDGTLFGIVESHYADRSGHVYDGPIVPDTVVAAPDDAVRVAAAWLLDEAGRPRAR